MLVKPNFFPNTKRNMVTLKMSKPRNIKNNKGKPNFVSFFIYNPDRPVRKKQIDFLKK